MLEVQIDNFDVVLSSPLHCLCPGTATTVGANVSNLDTSQWHPNGIAFQSIFFKQAGSSGMCVVQALVLSQDTLRLSMAGNLTCHLLPYFLCNVVYFAPDVVLNLLTYFPGVQSCHAWLCDSGIC